MEARFEEACRKHEEAVSDMNSADFFALKAEIESLMEDLRFRDGNHDLLDKAEDMLVDVTRMIEETHCQPFKRSSK